MRAAVPSGMNATQTEPTAAVLTTIIGDAGDATTMLKQLMEATGLPQSVVEAVIFNYLSDPTYTFTALEAAEALLNELNG
jgi:hypothetical protein